MQSKQNSKGQKEDYMKIKALIILLVISTLHSCVITNNAEVKYTEFPSRKVKTTELYKVTRNFFGDPSYDWDIYWSFFPFMVPTTVVILGGDTVVAPSKILYGVGTYPFSKENKAKKSKSKPAQKEDKLNQAQKAD